MPLIHCEQQILTFSSTLLNVHFNISEEKFQNVRRLNYNSVAELADTISCFRAII